LKRSNDIVLRIPEGEGKLLQLRRNNDEVTFVIELSDGRIIEKVYYERELNFEVSR